MKSKAQHQLVGAFGEKSVEAELLRRGWLAVNANASVKNAADFDIFALKNGRMIHVRVKTCGPGVAGFQYSFPPNAPIPMNGITQLDFSILVRMGKTRGTDKFYVMPTAELRRAVAARRDEYLSVRTRKGPERKDTGQWTLHFRGGTNIDENWNDYLERWDMLEEDAVRPSDDVEGGSV